MDRETSIYFRDQFREARAEALRDAEGFQEILFVLERFGAYLKKSIGTLGSYATSVKEFALISPLADPVPANRHLWHIPFAHLYDLVREARNDALHQGAFARHLTNNAVQLALVLEDALMSNQNKAGDYMVREPVCASLWQPVSFIRQTMLVNSFTYLPIFNSCHWFLISDYCLAKYLRSSRNFRLAKPVREAIKEGLELEDAVTCFAHSPIDEVLKKSEGKPVLVIDGERAERLVGIVTPFDFL